LAIGVFHVAGVGVQSVEIWQGVGCFEKFCRLPLILLSLVGF